MHTDRRAITVRWRALSWVPNAITSLTTALAKAGTPGTVGPGGPTQFGLQSTVDSKDLAVTSFNSWLGTADPGTVFGSPYANEPGNRGVFPLIINGNGTQFSISQLSFSATSSDSTDVLGTDSLGFGFAAGQHNYGADYVGIEFNGEPANPSAWTFIKQGAQHATGRRACRASQWKRCVALRTRRHSRAIHLRPAGLLRRRVGSGSIATF